MLKAVIFDFDGVIVDTEPLHYAAFQEILVPEGLGFSWDDYLKSYIGFDDRDAFRARYRECNVDLDDSRLQKLVARKAGAFVELSERAPLAAYAGVLELIRDLQGKAKTAICSGALASDIMPILQRLSLTDAFDVLVTADVVEASKPDPASYEKAVTDLGVHADECIAIEDTPAGIRAAEGAGVAVLAVSTTHDREALSDAMFVCASLSGFSAERLDRMLMEWRKGS
ncbi:MAG: HAD family phosphatase [Verrucomicrobia bacterium]|nr:HAD family phosphatase [Verrucomicrobiota bacterium]